MHWDIFKQDNCSTVAGDGGCRVGEVRAATTSPMPDPKGFKQHSTPLTAIMNENGGCDIAIIPSATYLARYNLLQSSFIILERVISSANECTDIAQ